jgi:hypothetical protein
MPRRTVQRRAKLADRLQFPMPSLFVDVLEGRIADAMHIDVVVDDRPENCSTSRSSRGVRSGGRGARTKYDRKRLGIVSSATSPPASVLISRQRGADTRGLMQRRLLGQAKTKRNPAPCRRWGASSCLTDLRCRLPLIVVLSSVQTKVTGYLAVLGMAHVLHRRSLGRRSSSA